MQRGSTSSIARVAPTSLTTPSFRWLHEEAWDDGQKANYAEFRLSVPAGLYRTPPVVNRHHRVAPAVVGRWLLAAPLPGREGAAPVDPTGRWPTAAVEVQLHRTQFESLLVFVSRTTLGSWQEPAARGALTLLVSALIILTKADRVRIIPLSPEVSHDLAELNLTPTPAKLLVPLQSMAFWAGGPACMHLQVQDIDPVAWWALPFAAGDRATLAYLEKRLATGEKEEALARKKPRRRGFLSSLLRS